jgi:hypothetical protein
MHFVYQSLAGDGSIIARLTSFRGGQAGVMVRETLNPAAADISLLYYGNANIQDRPTTGASAGYLIAYGVGGYTPPVWLELARVGSTFTSSISSDGVNWTQLGITTIPMAQTVYIGMTVSGDGSLTLAIDDFGTGYSNFNYWRSS